MKKGFSLSLLDLNNEKHWLLIEFKRKDQEVEDFFFLLEKDIIYLKKIMKNTINKIDEGTFYLTWTLSSCDFNL